MVLSACMWDVIFELKCSLLLKSLNYISFVELRVRTILSEGHLLYKRYVIFNDEHEVQWFRLQNVIKSVLELYDVWMWSRKNLSENMHVWTDERSLKGSGWCTNTTVLGLGLV